MNRENLYFLRPHFNIKLLKVGVEIIWEIISVPQHEQSISFIHHYNDYFLRISLIFLLSDDIRAKFMAGVSNVASVSLAIGYPTVASVPHSIANGFKNLMAVAAATDIEFAQVKAH